MGYWGWRPLLNALFICVWITGCNLTNTLAPITAPTELPRITLTLRARASSTPPPSIAAFPTATPQPEPASAATAYTVRPGDTLLGIALERGVSVEQMRAANPNIDPLALQVGQVLLIPEPGTPVAAALPPIALELGRPLCYPTIAGSSLCLGKVTNPHAEPVGSVRVRVQLFDRSGQPVAETTTGLEQALIPPGQSAPYRVIFDTDSQDGQQAAATLLQAVAVPASDIVSLGVDAAAVEHDGRRYRVQAALYNDTGAPLGAPRIVLTLFDSLGQIAGFRAFTADAPLPPGAFTPIQIEVLALSAEKNLTYQLYAEARRSGN
jgi:LysM repeat protein